MIDGLYGYVDVKRYNAYLQRRTTGASLLTEQANPVKVRSIWPPTALDITWVAITLPSGACTSFPIEYIARYTNEVPEWDKQVVTE